MSAFPTLTSGAVTCYPLTRRHNFRTRVFIFEDLSEQRFSMGTDLAEFELVFNSLSTVDKETVRDFYNSARGAYTTTWMITLPDPLGDTNVWYGMQFLPQQLFQATETVTGRWNFSLKIRQTVNSNLVGGANGTAGTSN